MIIKTNEIFAAVFEQVRFPPQTASEAGTECEYWMQTNSRKLLWSSTKLKPKVLWLSNLKSYEFNFVAFCPI